MVEKNIRLKTHLGNGVYDTLHPETNSEIVRVGDKNLDETLGDFTAQLAQTETDLVFKTRGGQSGLPKLISFVTDDGRVGELDLGQVFVDNGYPLCGCIITDDMGKGSNLTWEQAINFQNNHGFEYGSHTVSHPNLVNDNLSDERLDFELKESKEIIERKLGRNCNYFVIPEGTDDLRVRNVMRKYYRASIDTLGGINVPPVIMHPLSRTSADTLTASGMKLEVDKLNSMENGWLIFMIHTTQDRTGDYTKFDDTLKYIQSLGLPVVTVSEGLSHYENKLDVGDFTKVVNMDRTWNRRPSETHTMIGADGELFSDKLDYHSRKISNEIPSISKPPSEYVLNTTTHEFVDNAGSEGFPVGAGRLITITLDKMIYSSQMFLPISNNQMYKRNFKDNTQWGDFSLVGDGNPIKYKSLVKSTDVVSDFELNTITVSIFNNAQSTENGFNYGAGTLYTHNMAQQANQSGWIFQEYHAYMSNRKFKRYWLGTAAGWSAFQQTETPLTTIRSVDLDFGTVSAQSTKDLSIPITVGSNLGFAIVKPTSTLPAGVTFNVMSHQTNILILRISNITAVDIGLGVRKWDITFLDIR